MADKHNLLESDIISLLQKHEPNMVRWSEIIDDLWKEHRYRYKDRQGFGVAATRPLKALADGGAVSQSDHFYETPKSIAPDTLSSILNAKKASAELRALKKALKELYTSQLNLPFYLVTSNPKLVHRNLGNWRAKRVRHSSRGKEDTKINRGLLKVTSRGRLTVSLEYIPKESRRLLTLEFSND